MPVQAARAAGTASPAPAAGGLLGPASGRLPLESLFGTRAAVQRRTAGAGSPVDGADVQRAADRGVATPGSALPHAAAIQRAFGPHDVSSIMAHIGGEAGASARAMGAAGFATGHHVVFDGAPDLHTAAHEAAHVVQQRAGVHLKGGVDSAGDVYERHADAVADAVVRGESAAALLDGGPAGGGGAGGGAAVQRKQIIQGKEGWREAGGKDEQDKIVDTTKLGDKARVQLREALGKTNPKLLEEIEEEWKELPSSGKDGDDEGELAGVLSLGDELTALEKKGRDKLEEQDRKDLERIERALLEARTRLQKVRKKGELDLQVQCVNEVLHRAQALTGSKGKSEQSKDKEKGEDEGERGVRGISLDVTDEDIEAYRKDVAKMGTWAGWAEAETLAKKLKISCAVYIKSGGLYHRVLTLGTGNLKPLSLLFLGNHYEVIGGVQDGTAVGLEATHIPTEKGGDCLFESMLRIVCDGGLPKNLKKAIQSLRKMLSKALSEAAIEESIHGILMYGDFGGLGRNMTRQVRRKFNARDSEQWPEDRLRERFGKLSGLKDLGSWDLDTRIQDYVNARAKDPSSMTTSDALSTVIQELRSAETALRKQNGEFDYQEYEAEDDGGSFRLPLDRPKSEKESDQVEQQAREATLARKDIVAVESKHAKGQYIITYKGKEYCLDQIGQLVPRYLRRNCSQENKNELSGDDHHKDRGLYPTGLSPYKISSSGGLGTGGNKIKKDSPEMQHVQGSKPSPFLSATALGEDALNPKGKSFGQVMTVVIDLSYIAPIHITALYTSKAICYFLLDGFVGDKQQTAQDAIEEQGQKKPSSGDLAKRNKDLSEKEWQALLDVIRTEEVLIDCMVPEEAVEKQK